MSGATVTIKRLGSEKFDLTYTPEGARKPTADGHLRWEHEAIAWVLDVFDSRQRRGAEAHIDSVQCGEEPQHPDWEQVFFHIQYQKP